MKSAEDILLEALGMEGEITEKDYFYNVKVKDALKAINLALSISGVNQRSELFSFADMRDAFDYASVSAHRYDAMTFKEWMSKR